MPEFIMEGIYRIGVVLPDNPLRELNSYLIRGEERNLLIDTGFRREECKKALLQGLRELQVDTKKLDILLTHHHSDHSGLAADIASETSKIYISRKDLAQLTSVLHGDFHEKRHTRYLKEGFPEQKLLLVRAHNPATALAMKQIDNRFVPLEEGDILTVGPYHLQMIAVPGHTSGNSMFWMKAQGVMFTGDHILFDISPNIMARTHVEDALGEYLESLEKVRSYPVRLALPGHRKSGNYRERIDTLISHHEKRLQEVLTALKKQPGMTAYEAAGHMTWRIRANSWDEFPPIQQWYAVGECMAHLDYLVKRSLICREEIHGIRHYYCSAIPDGLRFC